MLQNNPKLRIAVVGTGYFSQFHLAAWQRMDDVELVAVCSPDDAQAKHCQQQFNIPQRYTHLSTLIEQCDVNLVDLITPPSSHRELILECVKSDKAVICQKPFCESLRQAEQLVNHISEQDGFVAVHENFRFQPWYQQIKSILQSGKLGDLYEIRFTLRPGDGQGPNAYLQRQPYFQTQKRFLIQETGVHFIDVFRYLFGEINGLFARLSQLNPAITGEDAGMVLFEFTNGARGLLNANRLSDHSADDTRRTMGEMHIEGSLGTLSLNGNGNIYLRDFGSNEPEQHQFDWLDNGFGGDCVFNTNRHIADHLLYGKNVHNVAADYLANRRIEEKVYESARRGQWLSV